MKTLTTFGLALLIIALLVLAAIGFISGMDSLLGWFSLAAIGGVVFLHKKLETKAYMSWDDSYSVGVQVLDEDHQRLLHLINNFQTAAHYNTGEQFVRQALDELIDYTKTHFAREEQMMEENGYPDVEGHKKQHAQMIAKVGEEVERFEQDPDGSVDELLAFLKEWLIHHILGTDKEYGPFLNDKGVK